MLRKTPLLNNNVIVPHAMRYRWNWALMRRRRFPLPMSSPLRVSQRVTAVSRTVPSRIMLISPNFFCTNTEALKDNKFMKKPFTETEEGKDLAKHITSLAMEEHEGLVRALVAHDIEVAVFENTLENAPDATFCNNWLSIHREYEAEAEAKAEASLALNTGQVETRAIIYPMALPSRQCEVRMDILAKLQGLWYPNMEVMDLRNSHGLLYLEGTGSMVLDRKNRIVYAGLSPRTYLMKLLQFCETMSYELVFFNTSWKRAPVYHTNVFMAIGEQWAVICLDVIVAESQKEKVVKKLESTGRKVVVITPQQMEHYCGNILEVVSRTGVRYTVMSEGARDIFTKDQLAIFENVIAVPFSILETYGGGGVRCCMLEA